MVEVPRRTEVARCSFARREEGEYWEYLTDEQRSGAGWIAGRMQWHFCYGLAAKLRLKPPRPGRFRIAARPFLKPSYAAARHLPAGDENLI